MIPHPPNHHALVGDRTHVTSRLTFRGIVLVAAVLAVSGVWISSGCSSSSSPPAADGGDGAAAPELGEAQVTFPDDGQTLLIVQEEDGVGSATYAGTFAGEDPIVSGITADTGQGTLQIALDSQQRPTQVTLNALTLLISYGGGSDVSYQLLENGSVRFTGSVQVDESQQAKPLPDERAMRFTKLDIETCASLTFVQRANALFENTLHISSSSGNLDALAACVKDAPAVRELFDSWCVVVRILNERMDNVLNKCHQSALSPGRCEAIVGRIKHALSTWTFFIEPMMDDALYQLWQNNPLCRSAATVLAGGWEIVYSPSGQVAGTRRTALQIDDRGHVEREWTRAGGVWVEMQRYTVPNTSFFQSMYTNLEQSTGVEPDGTTFRIRTAATMHPVSYHTATDGCLLSDTSLFTELILSNLAFDGGSTDRFSGQFEQYIQVQIPGAATSENQSSGAVTATRISGPPAGALSQEDQVDGCWSYRQSWLK